MNQSVFFIVAGLCATFPNVLASQVASPPTAKTIHVSLANEASGREPKTFAPLVGSWLISKDAGKNVLFIDGRVWKRGQPAGGLADKARELYGARNEEFIESIKAFAYFPIAVYKGLDNFENGEISVRFQMVGGTLDRAAGILFDVKPNGDYLTVRYNGTEDNVVLWTFNNGVRKFVNRAPTLTPLELGTWHTLKISVHGTQLKSWLDDQPMHDYTLPHPVSGKVGVWSKTDSMIEFADFTVTPMSK
jgi:laminin G domain protein